MKGSAFRFAALLIASFLAVAVLFVAPASAHSGLVASDPEPGSVLDQAPSSMRLDYSESVQVVDGWEVLLPDGTSLPAAAEGEGRTVTVRPEPLVQRGTHVLTWQVLSPDGHVIRGSLPFAIGEESALVVPPADGAAGPGSRAVLGVLLCLGSLVVVGLSWSRRLATGGGVSPPRVVPVVAGVAGLLALAAGLARLVLLRTDVGQWVASEVTAQVALVIGLAALALRQRLLGGVLVLLSLALVGHTRAGDRPWLTGAADLVHAGAGAIWVGGLVALVLTARRADPVAWQESCRAFSNRAAAALAAVAVSGVVLATQIHQSWSDLWHSDHGRLLLVKVCVVAAAAVLGAWHRGVVRRRVGSGVQGIRTTTRVEAALLLAVVAVSGLLGELSPVPAPPHHGVVDHRIQQGDLTVRVRVAPAAVGPNQIEVQVRDAAGSWVPLAEPAKVVLRRGATEVGGEMRAAGESQLLTLVVPHAGDWQLSVSLRLSRFEEPVISLPVEILAAERVRSSG